MFGAEGCQRGGGAGERGGDGGALPGAEGEHVGRGQGGDLRGGDPGDGGGREGLRRDGAASTETMVAVVRAIVCAEAAPAAADPVGAERLGLVGGEVGDLAVVVSAFTERWWSAWGSAWVSQSHRLSSRARRSARW